MAGFAPLRPVDAPPESASDAFLIPDVDSADVPPARPKLCAVEGCENPSALTPTGRAGKYCEEHGSKSKDRPASGTRRNSSRLPNWPKAAEVENALNLLFKFGGAAVVVINEVDGNAISDGGPAVSKALVDLGRTDKRVRKYLEALAAPGKYGPLTLAVAGIAVPIMANHGLIPTFHVTVPPASQTQTGEN